MNLCTWRDLHCTFSEPEDFTRQNEECMTQTLPWSREVGCCGAGSKTRPIIRENQEVTVDVLYDTAFLVCQKTSLRSHTLWLARHCILSVPENFTLPARDVSQALPRDCRMSTVVAQMAGHDQ